MFYERSFVAGHQDRSREETENAESEAGCDPVGLYESQTPGHQATGSTEADQVVLCFDRECRKPDLCLVGFFQALVVFDAVPDGDSEHRKPGFWNMLEQSDVAQVEQAHESDEAKG